MTGNKLIVDFEPIGKRVEVAPGTSIMDAARQGGVPLKADCGGSGFCGKCRVIARDSSHLSPVNLTEQKILSDEELDAGFRLACQTFALDDVKIDIPHRSLSTKQRLQMDTTTADHYQADDESDFVIQVYPIQLSPANMHDLRSDLTRVLDALEEEYDLTEIKASPRVLRTLSPMLREHEWQVQAVVRDDQIVAFLAPDVIPLGLAVDLGTTKIAAYLVDMSTGQTLGSDGRPNPQIGYGEDVISRLVYCSGHENGLQTLSGAVFNTLSELASSLCEKTGHRPEQICEMVVVGNTAMMHILMQLPVRQLSVAPYISTTTLPQETLASEFGLAFAPDCHLYIPPMVAGYVGADLVAMTLASNIGQDGRTVLGVDIGTNTEIVLSIKGQPRMYSVSCASGPAFEGAHISAGMRAAPGAVEKVHLNGGGPNVQTIDNKPAVGICGSGIIDAIAELRRVGAITPVGRLQPCIDQVRKAECALEFVLVPAENSGSGSDILITQHDIEEIQLAKGAIMAGIAVLLENSGIKQADLDEIVLAGAFGTYLNIDTSVAIGLMPDQPLEKYRQVGNAAGEGAREILISREMRTRARELARQIDYVELTVYPGFRRIFAKAMHVKPIGDFSPTQSGKEPV